MINNVGSVSLTIIKKSCRFLFCLQAEAEEQALAEAAVAGDISRFAGIGSGYDRGGGGDNDPDGGSVIKTPSDSYELFVWQEKGMDDNNKEKMSIKSDGGDSIGEGKGRENGKVRRVSKNYFTFLFPFRGHI